MSIFKINIDIEKSIEVDASIDAVWTNISDTKQKNIWSPWMIFERDCEQKTKGRSAKVGYREYWNGKIVGEGEQIITDISKNQYIVYDLNFIKPFKSKNTTSFHLESISENKTKVIWKMSGSLPIFLFFLKKMMTFMIGKDFERGLKMLKELLEKGELDTETKYNGQDIMKKKYFIGIIGESGIEKLGDKLKADFTYLNDIVKEHNIKELSFFTRYLKTDMINNYFEFEACVEISENDYKNFKAGIMSTYKLGSIEETKVSITTHYGSYNFIDNSWTGAYMYTKANKLKIDKSYPAIELYENGPLDGSNENDFVTHILFPIK
ncbi:MAG: SRPBCC family protein [Candidatus Gracilibacteria bacterium]|nr:SRPBCC family protein [Candidatus Gracilibacteria bacterium]